MLLNRLRVFLLGPSHHFFLSNIALSELSEYETPLGNIRLDRESNYYHLKNC